MEENIYYSLPDFSCSTSIIYENASARRVMQLFAAAAKAIETPCELV